MAKKDNLIVYGGLALLGFFLIKNLLNSKKPINTTGPAQPPAQPVNIFSEVTETQPLESLQQLNANEIINQSALSDYHQELILRANGINNTNAGGYSGINDKRYFPYIVSNEPRSIIGKAPNVC